MTQDEKSHIHGQVDLIIDKLSWLSGQISITGPVDDSLAIAEALRRWLDKMVVSG